MTFSLNVVERLVRPTLSPAVSEYLHLRNEFEFAMWLRDYAPESASFNSFSVGNEG